MPARCVARASSAVRRRFGQPGQAILTRQFHELLPIAAIGEEKINEQRDHQHTRTEHDRVPAQFPAPDAATARAKLQLAFQLGIALNFPIRLEPGAQRRRCLGSLPIVAAS